MENTKLTHVYLGRFSPFHKGHQTILSRLISEFGAKTCLVVIGSINTRNERTPYTFEQRMTMVNTLFPEVEVIGLPDGKPNLLYFDGSTNEQWLDNLEVIQNARNTEFVFYGGSDEDLKVLAERFKTKVLTDREDTPLLSATNVREALKNNNLDILEDLIDTRIKDIAVDGYKEFINLRENE